LSQAEKNARRHSLGGIAKSFDLKAIAQGVKPEEQGRVLNAALREESSRRNIS